MAEREGSQYTQNAHVSQVPSDKKQETIKYKAKNNWTQALRFLSSQKKKKFIPFYGLYNLHKPFL